MANSAQTTPDIYILKQSGEKVKYNPDQLRRSLERSGAGEEDIRVILKEVRNILYDGISTKKIYRIAYDLLRKRASHATTRYRLKQAIMDLGPTGYPFERFVGALLAHQGYRVETGVLVKGRCVQHEVDVVAVKDHKKILVECKFHHDQGTKSDVKVPMYIRSRFEDIRKELHQQHPGETFAMEGWLVTNTRFTADAISFGSCSGLRLISWDYPAKGSLRERIDLAGLYPVTCLHTLTRNEKKQLLEKEIVMCRELASDMSVLSFLGISAARLKRLKKELDLLFEKTRADLMSAL
ncbi:MAG TPA: ATPase [Bacteroidetes bacterium]|nr:ATPase [Bacteroidota bacterium]